MPQAIINSFLTEPPGPTFFPDDIAGLIRWYDASSFSGFYSSGDPITTDWVDNSTSAEDAVPDVTDAPEYNTTDLVGGKSAIYFPDGFHHFATTEMTLGDFSVVAFYRPLLDTIIAASTSGNYQVRENNGLPGSDRPSLFINGGDSLDFIGAQNSEIWHVRTWTREGASGIPFFYYNKVQEPEKDGQTRTTSMKINTVGLFDGGPGEFYMAEMLIYNVVLTQADVDNLHDFYFSLKYPGNL